MQNNRANTRLFSASVGTRETAINTAQTVDQTLLIGVDDYPHPITRNEINTDEATGKEEPTEQYRIGQTLEMPMSFQRGQSNHFAFLGAYGLGQCASVVEGSGYKHTITPIPGDLDNDRSNPTCTGQHRVANAIDHELLYSLACQSFTLSFPKDSWVSAQSNWVGTGRIDYSTNEEQGIQALDNVTQITLGGPVQGATAEARLDNFFSLRAYYNGAWRFINVTSVSAASPAVVTFSSLGGAGATIEYRAQYMGSELSYPARIVETPLRVSQLYLTEGGTWTGTAFEGGRLICSKLSSFEWSFTNEGMDPMFTACAGGDYAGEIRREARNQTLTLNRELKDVLAREMLTNNEYFQMHAICTAGEFATGEPYTVELVFPRLAFMDRTYSTDRARIQEGLPIQVLEDATYGSVIMMVKNQVATYAA